MSHKRYYLEKYKLWKSLGLKMVFSHKSLAKPGVKASKLVGHPPLDEEEPKKLKKIVGHTGKTWSSTFEVTSGSKMTEPAYASATRGAC